MDLNVPTPIIDSLGVLAGILTTASFVPQLIRTWKMKSARDLSFGWIACFAGGCFAWLTYGFLIHSWPVIIANTCTLTLVGFLLGLKIKYHS